MKGNTRPERAKEKKIYFNENFLQFLLIRNAIDASTAREFFFESVFHINKINFKTFDFAMVKNFILKLYFFIRIFLSLKDSTICRY